MSKENVSTASAGNPVVVDEWFDEDLEDDSILQIPGVDDIEIPGVDGASSPQPSLAASHKEASLADAKSKWDESEDVDVIGEGDEYMDVIADDMDVEVYGDMDVGEEFEDVDVIGEVDESDYIPFISSKEPSKGKSSSQVI